MPTGFVKAGFGISVWEEDKILNPIATLTLYDQVGNEIGYVTSISPSTNRNVTRQRHLNAADAGRVVELTHQPEDYSLTLEGFLLYPEAVQNLISGYLSDRIQRADQVFEILNRQFVPFNLLEEMIHPSTGKGYRVWYMGCKIQSWNGARRINTGYVSETVSIIVSWKDVEVV